tara:strand:- start:370 stop:486 length:117 start_codon:yes stop_codon:yes gene_type:complete
VFEENRVDWSRDEKLFEVEWWKSERMVFLIESVTVLTV